MNLRALAVLSATLVAPSFLCAQGTDPAPRVTTDAVEVKIGGRLHTQFNTTSIDGQPVSQLLIRRARV